MLDAQSARQLFGKNMSKLWRILSIDGGGIRGLIPATILSVIEQRTGKRCAQLFDIIAGTSTGGILALGLTKPDQFGRPQLAANDLRDVYKRDAPHIFRNPASWWENLIRPKYVSSSGISRVMRDNLGDTRLKDAVSDILIPCYDIEQRSPHIFRSHWARRQEQHDFHMSDVACAAAATPTMFEPVRLPRPGADGHISLVDGGVFANNPSLLAFAEVNKMFAAQDDNYLVVSLGTGASMERMRRKYLTDWGYVRWSIPMIELVSESSSEAVHEQMRYLLPPTHYQRYYRFQVDLPDDVYYALDNPSQGNMAGLIDAAEKLLSDPQTEKEISTLCELLLSVQHEQHSELVERIDQPVAIQASAQDDELVSESARETRSSRLPNLSVIRSRIEDCKVVLCYAGEDLDVVRPLADALKERGITAVFGKFDSQPQESIRRLVSHAADRSLIIIVVLSPALLKNPWASKPLEWLYSRSLSGKSVILPVTHRFRQGNVLSLSLLLLLARHFSWPTMPAKHLKHLIDTAKGTTADGIGPLADLLVEDLHLWFESQKQWNESVNCPPSCCSTQIEGRA